MSPLVSCLLLVFLTVAHSGVLDPRVADINLKLSWVTETRMELMIGERRRNILLTPTTNIPDWKTSCLFTGKLEGDLDSEVSVSGCHNSNETMVSIASSLLPDGFVEFMIVDGNTKNMDSANISGETEGQQSMENLTTDYVYPPADPFERDVHPWSGPLPSTVVLKTDIKYDNSLLEHFDYSHAKTKDWIKDVVQLAKPMMSHNTLSIKVALEIGEVTHIDETLDAENHTIYYLQQTKNHKSLTSYFCKDPLHRGYDGIAFIGTACNPMYAININELSYSDYETARTFAHELGHNIGMDHDFHESHGGHHGKCDHQGLMSYGQHPTQWSSCSDKNFTTWWREKGHVCLKKTTDKQHGDSYDDSDYDTIETDEPDSSHYDDSDYDTIETDEPVSCGNHKASNCGGCPQGHGARWCNGDCRWWHGQCVARSGTAPPNKSEWNEWAPWSDCYNKEMFRVRNCKHQTPSNGGALCPGPSIESKDCPPGPGPDSGDWGKWW